MKSPASSVRLAMVPAGLAAMLSASAAPAMEPISTAEHGDVYGRYAPAGDCRRSPQIVLEKSGLTIDVDGARETVARPEIAHSYGGNSYQGISLWMFPYSGAERPVLFAFNAGEKRGALTVEPHDRGWKGGPKLAPRHQALVTGSPYAKCR